MPLLFFFYFIRATSKWTAQIIFCIHSVLQFSNKYLWVTGTSLGRQNDDKTWCVKQDKTCVYKYIHNNLYILLNYYKFYCETHRVLYAMHVNI